jgi:hypothetical protein
MTSKETAKKAERFAETLNVFTGIVGKRIDLTMRKYSERTLDAVFRLSPVDSGLFRRSWNPSLNKPDRSRLTAADLPQKRSAPPQGTPLFGPPRAKFQRIKKRIKADSVVYITNTQPYAGLLERGSSQQAPQGIIRPSVTIMRFVIEKIVREAKQEVPDARSG